MNEQQPIMISPFGPIFLKFQLPNDMLSAVLEESESMKLQAHNNEYLKEYDWSEYLVGKNTNQLLLNYDFFVGSNLQSFLIALGEYYLQRHHSTDDDVKNTKLAIAAAWLNVTKKHDYNCIHDHNKSPLSGIIYLKEDASIGEEIDKLEENSKIKGGSYLPGVTHFIYSANKNFLDSTSFSFRGKPGDVLIFPGWVSHLVNPFTAEGERMTLAFNFHNDENVIHKYPKESQ
jgi:hypothetical protein